MRRTLDGWLDRQAKRAARIVTIEDALLGNRFPAYARYRLRFFLARYLVASVVYGIRFLLLFSIFSQDFLAILRVHAAAAVVATFWWGALETLRDEVRVLHRNGRTNLIAAAVGTWLHRAGRAGSVIIAATGAWVVWRVALVGGFGPADLFVAAVGVRLAASVVTRTYHSGIYAIRRVYRPLSVMIGADVSTFALTLLLWPAIGPWSFPIASILSSIAFAAITVVYTSKAYRLMGLVPRRAARLSRRPEAPGFARTLLSGASFAALRLDALLVLFLFRGRTETGAETIAFALFFVLGPTVRAGFEWAQLFYFDLKKLEVRPTRRLRLRLERHLTSLSWVMGLLFWAVAAVAGTVIFRRNLGLLYPLTLAFFLVRSRLAVAQIRAFADERYGELLASGLACAGGFFLTSLLDLNVPTRLTAATAAMAAAGMVLVLVQRRRDRGAAAGHPVSFAEWLDALARRGEPTMVGAIRFWARRDDGDRGRVRIWHEEQRWRYRRLAGRAARHLGRDGRCALLLPDRIVWWEAEPTRASLDRTWIARSGGGHVEDIDVVNGADGGQALARAAEAGLLGPSGTDASEAPTADELVAEFAARFRAGVVLDLGSDRPAGAELEAADRRDAMAAAMRFARDLGGGGSRHDVTAVCREGEIIRIFVVPHRANRYGQDRWRRRVAAVTIREALDRSRSRETAAVG